MARDVYYQSAGNPLQWDRLPATRSDLQLPYHPYLEADDQKLSVQLLLRIGLLGMASMLGEFLNALGPGLLSPHLLLIAIGTFLLVQSLKERSAGPLKLPLACVVAVWLFFEFRVPLIVHALLACTSLGVLTGLLAMHWTNYCTASPMQPAQSQRLRDSWQRHVSVMAVVPVAVLLAAQIMPPALTSITVVVVPLVLLTECRLRQGTWPRWSAGWQAVRGWLTYNRHDVSVPGTYQSPTGSWPQRIALTCVSLFLMATLYVRWPLDSPDTINGWLYPTTWVSNATGFNAIVLWCGCTALSLAIPLLLTLSIPVCLTLPVLAEAERHHSPEVKSANWESLIEQVQSSADPCQRQSLYMGRIVDDGSPLLVPETVFHEHAHFLGDSGSGKTSRGLLPLLEQLIVRENCSVVVIDLKADTRELLGTLQAAADKVERRSQRRLPLKYFTNQVGRDTFAFNPLLQPFWNNLELYLRTDIQCGALGLTYGADYGEGYFGSANSAVLYHTIKTFPDLVTYRDLAHHVGLVVANAKKQDLHPEIRKAGVHVQTVLNRLGAFEALNVAPGGGYSQEVLDNSIDLTQLYTNPQLLYFHLSSTLAPGSSPEIARLVTYSLLAAATQVQERPCQVYLVIDEFQRMVARNVEYMLQLARSMGVGVILANQSMQDLRTATADLIPPIEANCRYRQWFSVSAAEDRQRLMEGSGETVDLNITRTTTRGGRGQIGQSVSYAEQIRPRLSLNDILLTSDAEQQSFVRIARGAGYAQYGGMPIRVESDYHITQKEHERRKAVAWPHDPGTFVASRHPQTGATPATSSVPTPPTPAPANPTITSETVGGSTPAAQMAADLFQSFQSQTSPKPAAKPAAKPRRKRRRRRQP